MKYRKKPRVIEAHQFTGLHTDGRSITEWINDSGGKAEYHESPPHIRITTLEGVMAAGPNDYIIRGVAGEFYPCKPLIFEETYDEVPG